MPEVTPEQARAVWDAHLERRKNVEREKALATVVSRWFGQNPGTLVGWVIEEDGIVATFRCPLTPEEVERYQALVAG